MLWRNATVVDPDGLRQGMDIFARDGVITRVVPSGSVPFAGSAVFDCRGRLLIPAYVNAHHHFYSALLRGLPPLASPPRNQRERLERLVWPYERSLTQNDVRAAVRVGLLEATLAGTTTIFDHHVSAGCIDGILDVIAEEVDTAGLRGVLCYEITNRDGDAIARDGLRETRRFLKTRQDSSGRIAGMVGLHAMSTVDDQTLESAVALTQQFDTGLHLHLGEAAFDTELSVARYGHRPVARLEQFQALTEKCLVAHAIDISADERASFAERNVMVVHNPRSNASNGLGPLDLEACRLAGITVGLGGDGFTQDIRSELPLATLLQRQGKQTPQALPPREAVDLGMRGNAEIVRRVAGWETGRIAAGYVADLVVLSGEPTIPLTVENAAWHVSVGLPGFHVRDVFAGGLAVLRDGDPVLLDAERIRREARAAIDTAWLGISRAFDDAGCGRVRPR